MNLITVGLLILSKYLVTVKTSEMPGMPPGMPSGMAGMPLGMAGMPSGMAGTPSGMAGTPSGMAGTPSGMAGTPSGMAGTPSGMAGMPDAPVPGPKMFGYGDQGPARIDPMTGYGNQGPPQRMMGMSMDPMMGTDTDLVQYSQNINIGRFREFDFVPETGCNCNRDCEKYPEPRICYYKFYVEQYTAMGPACLNCTNCNTTQCYQQQCITGDGIERTVYVVNRMMPGTGIFTCYGDWVVIDVMNLMPSQAVSIHWHGELQRDTPWMDGSPWLTQCPIPPNGQFRYYFETLKPFTKWWHSHMGNNQRDGLYGIMVTRLPRSKEPKYCDYDYDLAHHNIIVQDYTHTLFDDIFPGRYRNLSEIPAQPNAYLINGMGNYEDNVTKTCTPLKEYHVKCGKKYRFRVIGATEASCNFQLTIEKHTMEVIALDGNFVRKPVIVNTLTMAAGMRTDFMLRANQKCGTTYTIAVVPLDDCVGFIAPQRALLVYDDNPSKPPAPSNLTSLFTGPKVLDYLRGNCSDPNNICTYEIEAYEKSPARLTDGEPDHRFFLDANSYAYTFNDMFNNPMMPYQSFYEPVGFVAGNEGVFADTFSNCSSMMPPCPLLTQNCSIPKDMFCSNDCRTFRSCINLLHVRLNSIVELVMTDGMGFSPHPFHIHGHDWAVMAQGSAEERAQYPKTFWKRIKKTRYPTRRDTTTVPPFGYVVLRFQADNPGFWMLHCHYQDHLSNGMFAMVQVGERKDMIPPPQGFPKCEPWLPNVREIKGYSKRCHSTGYGPPNSSHKGCSCGNNQCSCQTQDCKGSCSHNKMGTCST